MYVQARSRRKAAWLTGELRKVVTWIHRSVEILEDVCREHDTIFSETHVLADGRINDCSTQEEQTYGRGFTSWDSGNGGSCTTSLCSCCDYRCR